MVDSEKAGNKTHVKRMLPVVVAAVCAAFVLVLAALQWYPPLQPNIPVSAAVGPFLGEHYSAGQVQSVDVNTAPLEELCVLPGIGEVRAQAIIEYRQAHGPFAEQEDLLAVHGLGPKTVQGLEGLICF